MLKIKPRQILVLKKKVNEKLTDGSTLETAGCFQVGLVDMTV